MTDSILCLIRIKGHLTEQWSGWFGGLNTQNLPGNEVLLSGELPDQAAFFGVLTHIRDLGMRVVTLHCTEKGIDPPI